jgi:hypothetical protein
MRSARKGKIWPPTFTHPKSAERGVVYPPDPVHE